MNAKLNSAIARVSRRLRFKIYDNEDAKPHPSLDIRFCNKQFRSRILGNCQILAPQHRQPVAVRHRRTRSSLDPKVLSNSGSSELPTAASRGSSALAELAQHLKHLQQSNKHVLRRCSSELLALKRHSHQCRQVPPRRGALI